MRSYNPEPGSSISKKDLENLSPEARGTFARTLPIQEGKTHKGWNHSKIRNRLERETVFKRISTRLELTQYRRSTALGHYMQLNLQKFGFSRELVAFCVCALAVRKDGRFYHPNRSDENNDEMFLEVARNDLSEYEQRHILRCMTKIVRITSLDW